MGTDQDWTSPDFLEQAHDWIRAQLANKGVNLIGRIAQDHVQPWSTVLRIPTDRGDLFFKANHDPLRHEAAVVDFLSRRRPDVVLPPLAIDVDRGWMLMEDAGSRLREVVEAERSVERWRDVLAQYATLQLDLATSAEELIALGLPDMRLNLLPERLDELLDEIEPLPEVPADLVRRSRESRQRLMEMCGQLDSYGLAETVQHDDLNDGQVYVRAGRYFVLDWGDACVSHPFFSLSVALEGVISWGVDDEEDSVDTAPFRDSYLAPFAERLGAALEDLRAAVPIALRLGWACRAANGHVPGEDATPTVRRLQMYLDGRLSPD